MLSTSITRTARLAALGLVLTWAPGAAADDNHYQNYLIGERAVGLAGAFTAVADDSSAAFYNPAGLAEVPYSSLSLSAAVYGFASETVTVDAVGLETGGSTFISYPTTAAWIQLLREGDPQTGAGRMQAAVSLITPRSVVRRRRVVLDGLTVDELPGSTTDLLEVELGEDDSLWIGLSFAWKLHRRVSVGATLFTTMRTGMYQIYDLLVRHVQDGAGGDTDRRTSAQRIEGQLLHVGLLGVVGAVFAPTDRLRLGATFRTPLIPLHGKIKLSTMAVTELEPSGFTMDSLDEEAKFNDRQPFKATLGAAWFEPRRYGVSVDFSLYGAVGEHAMISDSGDPELDRAAPMAKKVVWQLNVGAEYYLLGVVPLRAGFFTNLSSMETCASADTPELCNELFADPVDRFGFAGSLGYEVDRATLNLGWSYNFGAKDVDLEGVTIGTARSYLMLTLGSSFRF